MARAFPAANQAISPAFDPVVRTANGFRNHHEFTIDVSDMDLTRQRTSRRVARGNCIWSHRDGHTVPEVRHQEPDQRPYRRSNSDQSPRGTASSVTLTIRPNTSGAPSEYRFTFAPPADIPANSNTITVKLDEDVQVPGDAPVASPILTDLSAIRPVLPDPVLAGTTVEYDLTFTNARPNIASGVQLTEVLPSGVSLRWAISIQGLCFVAAETVTCQVGDIAVSGAVVVSLEVDVAPSATGQLSLMASIESTELDPIAGDNYYTTTFSVAAPAPTAEPTLAATPVPSAPPLLTTPATAPDPTFTAKPTEALKAAAAPSSQAVTTSAAGTPAAQPSVGFCSVSTGGGITLAGCDELVAAASSLGGNDSVAAGTNESLRNVSYGEVSPGMKLKISIAAHILHIPLSSTLSPKSHKS